MFNPAKLRITHKGIIIVAIPLICELFFLGLLWHLLEQAEEETQRAQHSKEIIASGDSLIKLYYDAGTALLHYGFTQNKASGEAYDQIIQEIPKTFKNMHELVADQPEQQVTIARIENVGDRGVKMLERVHTELDKGERSPMRFLGLATHRKELQSLMVELSTELKMFVEPEIEAEQYSRRQRNIVRGEIKVLMFAGVTCSILLALMVAMRMTRDIVFRIAQVSDNTSRLAAGKELSAPLTGDDEIAYLDGVFRSYIAKQKEIEELKQDFLNMVSHDLRTPLCSLGTLLELFAADVYGPINEVGQSRLEMAEREVGRLLDLINALLDIEKMEAGKMLLETDTCDFAELAERAVQSVSAYALKRNIQIVRTHTKANVCADGDRIVQVLVNLISNAVKFSPDNSSIEIRAVDAEPMLVRIEVIDQGRGVPKDLQTKIFQRYEQVQASDGKAKRGTGLGLAICKAIVECHGGTIGVKGDEGKGSTFWFTLPLAVSSSPVEATLQS
jgi:signal transduction histidine kinase